MTEITRGGRQPLCLSVTSSHNWGHIHTELSLPKIRTPYNLKYCAFYPSGNPSPTSRPFWIWMNCFFRVRNAFHQNDSIYSLSSNGCLSQRTCELAHEHIGSFCYSCLPSFISQIQRGWSWLLRQIWALWYHCSTCYLFLLGTSLSETAGSWDVRMPGAVQADRYHCRHIGDVEWDQPSSSSRAPWSDSLRGSLTYTRWCWTPKPAHHTHIHTFIPICILSSIGHTGWGTGHMGLLGIAVVLSHAW
jgi:hypothetical protein